MLLPGLLDDDILIKLRENLANKEIFKLVPIELILPAKERFIDDLINTVYKDNELTQIIITALRDEAIRNWPPAIKKLLRIAYANYRLINKRIYYRDKLFVFNEDKLKT